MIDYGLEYGWQFKLDVDESTSFSSSESLELDVEESVRFKPILCTNGLKILVTIIIICIIALSLSINYGAFDFYTSKYHILYVTKASKDYYTGYYNQKIHSIDNAKSLIMKKCNVTSDKITFIQPHVYFYCYNSEFIDALVEDGQKIISSWKRAWLGLIAVVLIVIMIFLTLTVLHIIVNYFRGKENLICIENDDAISL